MENRVMRKEDFARQRAIESFAVQAEQQAAAVNMLVSSEIRQTGRDLFVALLVPHLRNVIDHRDSWSIAHIKWVAELSMNCAPYLHQAAGMVQIDDAKQWGKTNEHNPSTETERQGQHGQT
jgi:hypothetical protein